MNEEEQHLLGAVVLAREEMPGFIRCEGQQVWQEDYPRLFAKIGHAYGTADGFKFRLPPHIAGPNCITLIKT